MRLNVSYQRKWAIDFFCIFFVLTVFFSQYQSSQAQSSIFMTQGLIVEIQIKGLQLIEQGLIYSIITSQQGTKLSPKTVSEDMKAIYGLGYFDNVSAEIETVQSDQLILIFKVVEKPRIAEIDIQGNILFSDETLKEKLKIFKNNMVDVSRIKADIKIILEEYRKKGYIQTRVDYQVKKINDSMVSLTFKVTESPKVFLTEINISGTKVYPALDIERQMASAEIDCFSWANQSGVFQESIINQDLQLITQHYLKNGFIKVKIAKPDIVLIHNKDYSKVIVNLDIAEGDQYFTGKVDFVSNDGHEFLFDREEMIEQMALQTGAVYNPYKQNEDRFKINDVYMERGYAFTKVWVRNNIHDETKTVDVTFHITRQEKAYIGRVEIHGNYETIDRVVRRELEIHDDELFNGIKLRESQKNINRLGFFAPGMGVKFQRRLGAEDNTLDYNILLEETQTGTFNASLSYSGYAGFSLMLSISKKNLFGTGKTVTFSTEHREEGEGSRYDFSLVSPYWLDTKFTNSFRIFSVFENETYYDTRSLGFNFGLSYPIWKNWSSSSTYSWKNEDYSDIQSEIGEESLAGVTGNTYRSLRLGVRYSTVDHPLFPSKGYEASLSSEQFGGPILSGSIEYRSYSLNTRYFKTLNEDGTIIFGAKFNWSHLAQTNPDQAIPIHKRYTIGGITTVRGFEWNSIRGPSGRSELPDDFNIRELYPYQGDYLDCQAEPDCPTLSTEKHPTRVYFEQHSGGIDRRILNLQLYFPLTREGKNIRGLVFYDAGNVWAEDRMYDITGLKKDEWYVRQSIGTGINLITPMGVLRFEYGYKLDRKEGESASKFDFTISGLF